MLRKEFLVRCSKFGKRYFSSIGSQINIEKLEKDTLNIDVIDEETLQREEELQRKRNKSRLKEADRNFVHERNPYPDEPTRWHQGTLKYMRKLYGRYGEASGVNPAICWPTTQELKETIEYERVAHPFTIPQILQEAEQKRAEKNERIRKQQTEIVKKLQNLEGWKKDLGLRIAKKEAEATAAKERKNRLIEEVRMHFGYKVDPKDDRFKEMLEKKEKEQRKAMKEARKVVKEAKVVKKILVRTEETNIGSTQNTDDK